MRGGKVMKVSEGSGRGKIFVVKKKGGNRRLIRRVVYMVFEHMDWRIEEGGWYEIEWHGEGKARERKGRSRGETFRVSIPRSIFRLIIPRAIVS